ncbi:hypothetical protein BXZ70DRAFT_952670 [Cristinia sonorae]|uniref:Uncharacterized protein n=1 Tax=Cristinia sonorae TaxID=1940300 RepID=A0A8K0XLQ1_9AGAR|nr:hypothetical protein BXZ70DRAFT_952670 [Cristinia sonorae]
MSDAVATPERSPSVRVTYSGKRKKRRASTVNSDQEQPDSDPESEVESSKEGGSVTTPAPATFNIPTVPAHAQPGLSTPVRPTNSRTSATPSSSRAAPAPPSTPNTIPPSPSRASVDDGASEAGTKPRNRKNEGDRIQFFKNDPNCTELSPMRAFCTKCQNWIVLSANRRYVMKNWIAHRKSDCLKIPDEKGEMGKDVVQSPESETKPPVLPVTLAAPPATPATPVTPITRAPAASPVPPVSPMASLPFPQPESISAPASASQHGLISVGPIPVPSIAEYQRREVLRLDHETKRKMRLQADPLVGQLHAHDVFCKACGQWVKLATTTRYSVSKWTDHRERTCPTRQQSSSHGASEPGPVGTGVDPSPRVHDSSESDSDLEQTESIVRILREDPQVEFFNRLELRCKYCPAVRSTEDDIPAVYAWWRRHKRECKLPSHDPPENQSSFTFWIPKFLWSVQSTRHVPIEVEPYLKEGEEGDLLMNARLHELRSDQQLHFYGRYQWQCRFCGRGHVMSGLDDWDMFPEWRSHKKNCTEMKPSSPFHPDKETRGWLSKWWPSRAAPRTNWSETASRSRKRSREEDDEGDERQNGRAVRPRHDPLAAGLWHRLSTSVAGLVEGVRSGYAAAASTTPGGVGSSAVSSLSMEED